jgi:hypothetical protein
MRERERENGVDLLKIHNGCDYARYANAATWVFGPVVIPFPKKPTPL